MQTLRKKTSPLKYKNETTRFLGDGVSFKAKLIGILEVCEARGDRMCQEALSDLKMAIRAAGEHKQRITIHIALDGLRLRDEKTGDSLYHHPVHKISFIAQDMTDSRAFGYIFGSPDTGHRFFGIKTDKAASQVVIAMRDLFQVVFALKKKEIELAKIHLEKTRFPTSPIFSDSSGSNSKHQSQLDKLSAGDSKSGGGSAASSDPKPAVADLVDLELELNSLQQGLNQMERITPSDPFGSKDDPFGDSFISYPKAILPPPPSGRERASRTSESSSLFSPKTPHTAASLDTSAGDLSLLGKKDFNFSHDFNSSHEEPSSGDWFTPSAGNSLFEEPALVPEHSKDEKHELAKQEILSQFDVFTELDPLELKNPPKKVLNDLVLTNQDSSSQSGQFQASFATKNAPIFVDPFGEDPFVKEDPFAEADFSKQDPFESEFNNLDRFKFDGLVKSPKSGVQFEEKKSNKLKQLHENASLDMSSESECAPEPPPRPIGTLVHIKPPPLPPKKQNDLAVKPPPRPPHNDDPHYDYMDNYETAPNSIEFVRNIEKSPPLPVPARKAKFEAEFPPERPKKHFNVANSEDDYLTPVNFTEPSILLPPPQKNKKVSSASVTVASYLETKPQLTTSIATDHLEGLDITLSQLTLSGLNELATKLKIPSTQLSNMTLVQLTKYLSNFVKTNVETTPTSTTATPFQANFEANFNNLNQPEMYDRYAVFRELMQEEIKQTKIDSEPEQLTEEKHDVKLNLEPIEDNNTDRYAALRDITIELKDEEEEELEDEVLKENKLNEEIKMDVSPNPLIEYTTPIELKETNETVEEEPARLTSGSLSDVVSGSSPEVVQEEEEEKVEVTAETWAIFDQAKEPSPTKVEPIKTVQSEEGVSPWSSDSKEFGNGSPPDWRGKKRRDQSENSGWWAEPPNRRSMDSYDEEYYCERPRRRRGWTGQGGGAAGGHSSSSRDVSPWEEEPRRRWAGRHAPRHKDWRNTDSWDEDDDYDCRFHWSERERQREHWAEERSRRRRDRELGSSRDRWCCPDWEQNEHEKGARYSSGRWSGSDAPQSKWRDRKPHDSRYYSRESQESPWEDEYGNEPEEPPPNYYLSVKRNWKPRPSSASEMDRKTGEIKSRHYLNSGGSDSERERRYKPNRRSRSRDSQYAPEPQAPPTIKQQSATLSRKKTPKPEEGGTFPRNKKKSQFENDFVAPAPPTKFKFDELETSEAEQPMERPRRLSPRYAPKVKMLFEDDFSPSEKSPPVVEPEAAPPPVEEPITSIKEETDVAEDDDEEDDSFQVVAAAPPSRKILSKNRLGGAALRNKDHLKKSESVNIFVRESDPFDDDFFCGGGGGGAGVPERRNTELRWTEDFDFDGK